MALFKLRKGREEPAVPAQPPQTVEAMRRRAIHRLIGAAVLVLAGVIGFPLFFDNQPRPIPVDLPIVIPDKGKVPALVAPPPVAAATVTAAPAVSAPVPAASSPAKVPEPAPKPAPAQESASAAVEPPSAATSSARPAIPVADPSAAKAADAGKARDLLEGKTPPSKPAAPEGRFIVQVGAFADADKVREVRRKVEGLGVKTYTQVVETKDGNRIRVRVGPFADKAEAARLAEKIRKLDLSPAILSL